MSLLIINTRKNSRAAHLKIEKKAIKKDKVTNYFKI